MELLEGPLLLRRVRAVLRHQTSYHHLDSTLDAFRDKVLVSMIEERWQRAQIELDGSVTNTAGALSARYLPAVSTVVLRVM